MRNRLIGLASAIAVALACAIPAHADNYVVRDGTGSPQTFCSKLSSGLQYPCHVMFGLFGGSPRPISTDDTGNVGVNVQSSALPAGAATSAAQSSAQASLSSIDTKLSSQATAAKQDTAASKLDTLHTDLASATPAGTNTIGDVGSASFSVSCTPLTLPGTGGTYASGDLVANSATAGSVTPLACVLGRYSGGPISITAAQILTSTTGLTGASFRLHEYTASPTVTNGNDGVFLSTASGHFCSIDVDLDLAFSNGALGRGAPSPSSTCVRVLSATQTIYVLVEARGAYPWTAAQTVTLTLEGYN